MFDDYIIGPQCDDFYDDRWADWDDLWPLDDDDR